MFAMGSRVEFDCKAINEVLLEGFSSGSGSLFLCLHFLSSRFCFGEIETSQKGRSTSESGIILHLPVPGAEKFSEPKRDNKLFPFGEFLPVQEVSSRSG